MKAKEGLSCLCFNLFKQDDPHIRFDYVICWSVNLDINEKKTLTDGSTLCLTKESGEWILKYGARKIIPVIELKSCYRQLQMERFWQQKREKNFQRGLFAIDIEPPWGMFNVLEPCIEEKDMVRE